MKLSIKLFISLLLFVGSFSYGQMNQYNYKAELKGVSDTWHKIILTYDIFEKVSPNLSDIRVFGITANDDTIEAPYLLKLCNEKIAKTEVNFEILNTSHNQNGYFFTFEIPTEEAINQLKLKFKQQNFDWKLKLEGSQNQADWFTITENYRILSIKNETTDFQLTKLNFPTSKYRFFRIQINSKEKPELLQASVWMKVTTKGKFRSYPIKSIVTKENRATKQTEIDVELPLAVPLSQVYLSVADSFDFYRAVTIKYLSDSFKTEKGWKYNYRTLSTGVLNSFEENRLKFNTTILRKLKILVDNQDNQPLNIDTIQLKGYVYELVTRFTEPATYFLTYGNKNATKPKYDINRFTKKLPKGITELELGNEQLINMKSVVAPSPLFKNKFWLWAVMIVLIVVIAWFSISMIRKS